MLVRTKLSVREDMKEWGQPHTSIIPNQGYLMRFKEMLNQTCVDFIFFFFFYSILLFYSMALVPTALEMVPFQVGLKWL